MHLLVVSGDLDTFASSLCFEDEWMGNGVSGRKIGGTLCVGLLGGKISARVIAE